MAFMNPSHLVEAPIIANQYMRILDQNTRFYDFLLWKAFLENHVLVIIYNNSFPIILFKEGLGADAESCRVGDTDSRILRTMGKPPRMPFWIDNRERWPRKIAKT